MSIYVEILVRAPMDALWVHTQTPSLHEQWDLRFSTIDYLPKAAGSSLQRFRYTTRIGFGLDVRGDGETIGERDLGDGSRSSALKFASEQPASLIREGSGYWKYIPTSNGIRFLTWYDYRTRFGTIGAAFDRLIFRPLLGWATAWSFDCLRLWLEEHQRPADAIRQTIVHASARIAIAMIFAYQALVPKLLTRSADEVALIREAGVPATLADVAVTALGLLELVLAVALLVRWRERWPTVVSGIAVSIATLVVAVCSPRYLQHAFNPFSLNLGVAALALVDWTVLPGIPTASRCRRRPEEQP
jgi:hypothetical protein